MKNTICAQAQEDMQRGGVVAIGNFDGVHLGHQEVIRQARELANKLAAPLNVLTFDPHPRVYFSPREPEFRLMSPYVRRHYLCDSGVDFVVECPFDAQFASQPAQVFVQDVLHEKLGAVHVFVGEDFRFGEKRSGNVDTLRKMGAEYGFGVSATGLVMCADQNVSSTQVRCALQDGKPRLAEQMLGRAHVIHGEIIGGEQRGRELGFPTANMSLNGVLSPKYGVYAVMIDIHDGPYQGRYHGAASIGVRPMFGDNVANCETYIFDFEGDLYGCEASVALLEYLRPELKFDSLEALIAQMQEDCRCAREILIDEPTCEEVG